MLTSEILALASAVCIALSSMFLSELRGRVALLQLARWQITAAFVMTGLASLALGGWRTVGLWQFWLLAASGMVGISLASTTYFATIYAVGPRITALLFSLTSPFALALGYGVLGETINGWQGLGVLLVLSGVVLAIGVPEAPGQGRSDGHSPVSRLSGKLWLGIILGVTTAFGQALGTLLARPAMASGVEPFSAMAVRTGVAAVLFIATAAIPASRGLSSAYRLKPMAIAMASAFLGTGIGMALLMAALHKGNVGIVSTLSSLTPVLVLPMVWIRSGKRPALSAWIGALIAIAGIALISLFSNIG